MFVDFRDEFFGYDDDIGMFIVELDDRRVEVVLKEKEKVVEDVKLRFDKVWLKIQEFFIENVVLVYKYIFGQIFIFLIIKCGIRDELVLDWERENVLLLVYQIGVCLFGVVGYRVFVKVEDIFMILYMM